MAGNDNRQLASARSAKRDEFYTRLTDIEKELRHYREHFRGKTVLCNCDDPFESNFFKYFALNFNTFGLRKLIATSYATSPVAYRQLTIFDRPGAGWTAEGGERRRPYRAVVTRLRDATGDGEIGMVDVAELFREGENELAELEGDGDFRSGECLALLEEADVVVTNPPFSLFREYVATLVARGKKFLILGNKNAITYKEIFPLIQGNRMWVGVTPMAQDIHFISPKSYVEELVASGRTTSYVVENGEYLTRSPSIWYTNLDIKKRHEDLILYRRYRAEEYPGYDNYAAIEVGKVRDIPCDYGGVMGVPITFLDKYNPEQFEIVGGTANGQVPDAYKKGNYITYNNPIKGEKKFYQRILIRNRKLEVGKEEE